MDIIPEHILRQRISSKKYYDLHKNIKSQKYQENKEILKKKSLDYYMDKYNNNEEFKNKRKEYMKQYQRNKRELQKIEKTELK